MSEDFENQNKKEFNLNKFENEFNELISKEINKAIDRLESKLQKKIQNDEKKRESNSLLILSNIQSQNEKLSKIEKNFKNSKILIISTIILFLVSLFLTFMSWNNLNNITYTLNDTKVKSEKLLNSISNESQIVLSSIKDSKNIYVTQKDLEYYHNELNHSFSSFARDMLSNNNSNIEKLNKKIIELEKKLKNTKNITQNKNNFELKAENEISLKELVKEYFSLTIDKFENIDHKLKVKFITRLANKLKGKDNREKMLNISKIYLQKIFHDFKYIKANKNNLNSDFILKINAKTSNFLKNIDKYLNS